MKFVLPRVYQVGYTTMNTPALKAYLEDTGQQEFWAEVAEEADNVSLGECLVSFFAKLCYASLVKGKNNNVTRTRSIRDNLIATLKAGHGSVFEHCLLNFVVTDCSRVFTHELVRHRAGTAFSQTSGRYVRTDEIGLVLDPILADCEDVVRVAVEFLEHSVQKILAEKGLLRWDKEQKRYVEAGATDFDYKKKVTSAVRRILPNGLANEIGFSVNLRELRHFIMVRTDPHAEWEIRCVADQIYRITRERYPLLYHDAKEKVVDGLTHVYGMKLQPYETNS